MFDGVHRGHHTLLDCLKEKAGNMGVESVVMTLEPHPRIVLSGGKRTLRLLTSLDEKRDLLEKAGIDKLVVIPFSRELSRMPPCEFMKRYLVDTIDIGHLILGFDNHFGYRGYWDDLTVTEFALKYDFGISRLEPLKEGNDIISSTAIRKEISAGSLDRANMLLGYPYLLKGKVVEGKKIGRMLGYPTANIDPDYQYKLIPADGVYAVKVLLDSGNYNAMLYIGPRPTIEKDSGKRTIEVNIFGFEDDIYDKNISIRFIYRLRADKKFRSRSQLLDQINKDKEEAIRLLES